MDFLLHTANVFLLISFSVRSMLLLRALNLVAGSFFIAWALTTPDPVTLYRTVGQIAAMGLDHLAVEASSHGLSQHRLDGLFLQMN